MEKLFDGLPHTACHALELAGGDYAFRQGDKTKGMFSVVSGEVQLRRHTRAGAVVVIHTALSGDSFAEASLFSDTYHCDAVASIPSRIIRIDRTEITRLLATSPEFAEIVTKQFAIQIQSYRRRIELLAIGSASERVFAALVEGLMTSDIKAFASEIGLSHEAVYRALSVLAKSGRIEKTGRGKYVYLNR